MATAQEIALKYMSPRYLRLQRHERYVEGTQYDGRAPFLSTDEQAPPLMERAPCVVYGLPKNAIRDLVDFMMGEDRYPFISGGSSEDDEEIDEEFGLNPDDSEALERWVNGPLTKSARLKAIFPEALKMAMKAGSVAVVATIVQGMPCLTGLPAKWCTPTFDPRTREVIKLEVKYPYIVEVPDPEVPGRWVEKCKLYRRVIDHVADTVYLPGDGREDGKEPAWKEDDTQTQAHGMGFCPVRWYAFDRVEPTAADFDGKPLHDCLHDEIDALNFSLSQRFRASLYSGDPQIVETGVDADTQVGQTGRAARVEVEAQAKGPDGKPIGVFTASPRRWGRGGPMRRKGPGTVWRYPEATSKVELLTLGSDATQGMTDNADDLRKKIAEDMSVVLIDPTDVKAFGAMSGKALAFMFARQVGRADAIRLEAGDNLILACVDLLMRMCLAVNRQTPGGLRIPGLKKVLDIIEGFERDVIVRTQPVPGTPVAAEPATQETRKQWFGPRLDLEWGRYFTASAEEENFLVTMCVQALTNGLMPLEVILEKLRDVFSFSSTEELMKRLEEAKAKAQEDQLAMQDKSGAIAAKHAPDKGGGKPPGKGSAGGAGGDKKG